MFVSRIGRCASIRRSTIGELERASTMPQQMKNAAASATTASSSGEPQPQSSPSVSTTISEISPPDRSSAPGTSTRDGERIGDSGTKRSTSTSESATGIEPSRKR